MKSNNQFKITYTCNVHMLFCMSICVSTASIIIFCKLYFFIVKLPLPDHEIYLQGHKVAEQTRIPSPESLSAISTVMLQDESSLNQCLTSPANGSGELNLLIFCSYAIFQHLSSHTVNRSFTKEDGKLSGQTGNNSNKKR